jgi:hypothetical protein
MLERSEAPGKRIKRIKKVFGPIKDKRVFMNIFII